MVTKFILVIFLLFVSTNQCFAQLSDFFKPVPPPDAFNEAEAIRILAEHPDSVELSASRHEREDRIARLNAEAERASMYLLRPLIAIPAIKITESIRTDAKVDAQFLNSVGGGISYQHLCWNRSKDENGGWVSVFSVSALVLISGDTDSEGAHMDISPALSVGIVDNLIMIGFGYDLGVVEDRSRWFGLLSIGLNNNN